MWVRISDRGVVTLGILSLLGTMLGTVADAQSPQVSQPQISQTQVSQSNNAQGISPQESDVDIEPPRLIYAPDPKYPKDARNLGHQGTSVLSLVVGIDGRTHDITVLRPLDEELDGYATAAVSKWRYQPALRDGQPVEVTVHARVRFRLYNKSYGYIARLWDRSDGNDPRADLMLSKAYTEGNGVPQDEQLAFVFLKMAADWNLPEAQYLMGQHYYQDSPGAPDYVSAYMWYALSKRAGGSEGEKMLSALASEMSPEQLTEAELLIDYWPELPPQAQ